MNARQDGHKRCNMCEISMQGSYQLQAPHFVSLFQAETMESSPPCRTELVCILTSMPRDGMYTSKNREPPKHITTAVKNVTGDTEGNRWVRCWRQRKASQVLHPMQTRKTHKGDACQVGCSKRCRGRRADRGSKCSLMFIARKS